MFQIKSFLLDCTSGPGFGEYYSIYNYGNYDATKVETFIFDTKLSLFSTGNSNKKIRFELYELERNL